MKKSKGAITVEAAIIVPLFILAIMTIAFTMKIYYTKEKVDYALNQAAMNIAQAGYIYEKSELLDLKKDMNQSVEDSGVVEELKVAAVDVSQLQAGLLSEDGGLNNFMNSFEDLSKGGGLQGFITALDAVYNSFQNDVLPLYEDGISILNTVNKIIKDPKKYAAAGANYAYITAETYLYLLYVDYYLHHSLEDSWEALNITTDINYAGSRFFYSTQLDNGSTLNDLISVKAEYNIKLPISYYFNKDIPIQHEVTLRAWTGVE